MDNIDTRPKKTVADSKTETTRTILYKDINGSNRLFGGRLMEWIDETSGITAMRHCGGFVTSASVDNLRFRRGANLYDVITLVGRVTYVGRTSMEVRTDVYVEDPKTGMRHMINTAYMTQVCIDDEGKPKLIPYGLEISGPSEQAEWEGALKRIELRKKRRLEGY